MMETFGCLGREASCFFCEFGDIADSDWRMRIGAFVLNVRQELSCALCRQNSERTFSPRFPQRKLWGVTACLVATARLTKTMLCSVSDFRNYWFRSCPCSRHWCCTSMFCRLKLDLYGALLSLV